MTESPRHALLVTRNLPPLLGGMERLNLNLAHALSADMSLAVCGPVGCAAYLPQGADSAEVRSRPLVAFLLGALVAASVLAWRRRPHTVVAGSGLTAPIAWLVARAARARLIVYAHGLDLVAPSRLYRWLWLPFIRGADLVVANSRNTSVIARSSGVRKDKIAILHPGTHVPREDPGARVRFRDRLGMADEPLLLTVGRLTPRKGVAEFVRDGLPAVLALHPEARLLVIGDDATDAVNSARHSERKRIQAAAADAGVSGAVQFLPPCDDATLSEAYAAADVHVFPVRDLPGDVEGFGMVAIEAAAHGLPTVAFDVGGVADAVVANQSGLLVPAGNYPAFASAIQVMLQHPSGQRDACRRAAAAFSWDAFADRLRVLLYDLPRRPGDDA